jgi:hypothetical protein
VNVTVIQSSVDSLKAAIKDTSFKLRKELAIAVNKTAAKTKSTIAKQVGKEITLPQKHIKKLISVTKKASGETIEATVSLKKTKQINLVFFKARQTKKGVTTKIYKGAAPQVDLGAFKVRRWKGRVMKRTGTKRSPLTILKGPSAAEVFKGSPLDTVVADTEKELQKQIALRVRYITLKKTGAI